MRNAKEAFAEVRSIIENKTPRATRISMPTKTWLEAEWSDGMVDVWLTVACLREHHNIWEGYFLVSTGFASTTSKIKHASQDGRGRRPHQEDRRPRAHGEGPCGLEVPEGGGGR